MAEVMADKGIGDVTIDEECVNTNAVNELNIPMLVMGCRNIIIAAGKVIVFQKFSIFVHKGFDNCFIIVFQWLQHKFIFAGNHKFGKAHRVKKQLVNFSNRPAAAFMFFNTKHRTCRSNIVFSCIFTKIFKGSYCTRTNLDFIKNKQCIFRVKLKSRFQFQKRDNTVDVIIAIEKS